MHPRASRTRSVPGATARGARFAFHVLVAVSSVIMVPAMAMAAKGGVASLTRAEGPANQPIPLMGALSGLSLLPFAFIMVTSFVKLAVVMAIIRQALGTNQIPPTQIITGLSLVLTIYVMHPTMLKIKRIADRQLDGGAVAILDTKDPEVIRRLATESIVPVREFLVKHAHVRDRELFFKVAKRMEDPAIPSKRSLDDLSILVPAFVLSELTEAFQIGFIIFLPFLIIDMVTSNILMALGMQMLQPTTVSLPFKLMLFILSDGWHLLTKGLVLGYS